MSLCRAPYALHSPDATISAETLHSEDVRIAKQQCLYDGEARRALFEVVTILLCGYGDIFVAVPFPLYARWISHLPFGTTVKTAAVKFIASKGSFDTFFVVFRRQVTNLLLKAMSGPDGAQYRHVFRHLDDMNDAVIRFVRPILQNPKRTEADAWKMMAVLCLLNRRIAKREPRNPWARLRWNSPEYAHEIGVLMRVASLVCCSALLIR